MTEETVDLPTLRARHVETTAMLEALKKAYDKLLFQHELLKRQVFGPKAESAKNAQAQAELPLLEFLAAIGVANVAPAVGADGVVSSAKGGQGRVGPSGGWIG